MISMSKAYSIRQLRMEGDSIAEISRKLEVSRDTVYKYLAADDLSPKPPQPRRRQSSLDRYRPLIESWLDEDERSWRKQRHTAHRIWARLRDEAGADVGESTVRNYVRRLKLERGAPSELRRERAVVEGVAQQRDVLAVDPRDDLAHLGGVELAEVAARSGDRRRMNPPANQTKSLRDYFGRDLAVWWHISWHR